MHSIGWNPCSRIRCEAASCEHEVGKANHLRSAGYGLTAGNQMRDRACSARRLARDSGPMRLADVLLGMSAFGVAVRAIAIASFPRWRSRSVRPPVNVPPSAGRKLGAPDVPAAHLLLRSQRKASARGPNRQPPDAVHTFAFLQCNISATAAIFL